MTDFQRYAVYQLVVVTVAAVTVLSVYFISHNILTALAGFSFLGLLGLRVGFLRRPVEDERDESIHQRAALAGHVALWLALVIWGVSVSLAFADSGVVPLAWVAPVVWVAWWLVTCVRSLTILVLDRSS